MKCFLFLAANEFFFENMLLFEIQAFNLNENILNFNKSFQLWFDLKWNSFEFNSLFKSNKYWSNELYLISMTIFQFWKHDFFFSVQGKIKTLLIVCQVIGKTNVDAEVKCLQFNFSVVKDGRSMW